MVNFFKRNIKSLAVIPILLFTVLGVSQEINFGAKAGLNISSLRGDYPDEIDKKKPIVSFHIGGFAEYIINKSIAIQPELLFSRQGGKSKGATNGFSISQSPKINYLNLALLGKYRVLKKLSVEFGPQIGYILTAKSKWEYKDNTDPSRNETVELDLINGGPVILFGETLESEGGLNRLGFGLNLGASYELNNNIFVQARYNLGLSIVDKNSTYNESGDSWSLKNSVIQFSCGYKF